MSLPRYLMILTLTAVLCLAAVAGVNLWVDPGGIYGNGAPAERQAVRDYVSALRESPHGLEMAPFSDRAVKLELARQAEARCYLTGSSQQMQIGGGSAPVIDSRCPSLVNLAVSGGTYEDLLIAVGALIDRQPATLIIGVGPWMLRRDADRRWTTLTEEYAAARVALGLGSGGAGAADDGWADRLANLINAEYLNRSLDALRSGGDGDGRWTALADRAGSNLLDNAAFTRPDGAHVYSRRYLADKPLPPAEAGQGTYKIAHPFVAPDVVAELSAVVATLQQRGWQVAFLLSPYHPVVFACHNADACAALDAVERAVRSVAADRGAPVIGGYDPRPHGLDATMFHDDMHASPEGLHRLWETTPEQLQRRAAQGPS